MKAFPFYMFIIILLFSMACTENKKTKDVAKVTDSVTHAECFMASDEADTAYLHLDYLKSGKVTGNMVIKFLEKAKNDGQLKGKFSGDTLFVDYTFLLLF